MWPNFFLAGAPKAGTTSLFEFLRQHPQIFLSPIKEPTFFARADLRPWDMPERARAFLEKDRRKLQKYLADPRGETHWHLVLEEEDYLKLFSRVRDERAIGEASVSYFWRPSAAVAIAARVPQAKLVFMLRDPADRLFSHYLASLRSTPGTSFRECFRSAKSPESPLFSWLEGGLYATNLQRFFAAFPREQIRVYLYDDYRNDPRQVLRDLFSFLGVDPDAPIDTSRRYNEPALPRFPLLHRLRRKLWAGPVISLVPTRWRSLAAKLYLRDMPRAPMDASDRALVIEYFRDEIERTAELLGRDLSAWLR